VNLKTNTRRIHSPSGRTQQRKYTCVSCGGPVNKTPASELGLGTWHCQNSCKKRRFTVTRFTGSGAENMKRNQEAFPVRRAIAVKVNLQGV
jgi:hypothetical protein